MPQLSPLNWIFLFFLAWASIFLVFSMLWWSDKLVFPGEKAEKAKAQKSNPEPHWPW